jgi:hypothetical protein
VLQVTPQSIVIVAQNEGEISLYQGLVCDWCFKQLTTWRWYWKSNISPSHKWLCYHLQHKLVFQGVDKEACVASNTTTPCHHLPTQRWNELVEKKWSVRDASKVHFGNHTHKGLCSHLQHKLVCHLHGKLDCLGDSKQALCKWRCNPLSLSPTWSWTEPSTDFWSVIKWADAIPYTWRGILGREILLQTCNNTSIPSIATLIRSIQI